MKRQITINVLPDDASSLDPPFEDDYALLLVIASPSVSVGQRDRITSDIVSSRCQYALAFGYGCELWHDVIDETCVGDGTTEGRFLMTTWHDDEAIDDVVDFLWWNTSYADFESERLAVVLIGADNELQKNYGARHLRDLTSSSLGAKSVSAYEDTGKRGETGADGS